MNKTESNVKPVVKSYGSHEPLGQIYTVSLKRNDEKTENFLIKGGCSFGKI